MHYISRRWDASLSGDSLKLEGLSSHSGATLFLCIVNLGKAGMSVAGGDVEARPRIPERMASHLTCSSLCELQLNPWLYSDAWEEAKAGHWHPRRVL